MIEKDRAPNNSSSEESSSFDILTENNTDAPATSWDDLSQVAFKGEIDNQRKIDLYDADLNKVENSERHERISESIDMIKDFVVENYGIDEGLLQKRIDHISAVDWKINTPHKVQYNDKIFSPKTGAGATAFNEKRRTIRDGDNWSFENAVYFDDSVSSHDLRHELTHALSANDTMSLNEKGIAYDKIGLKVVGYNDNEDRIDNSLNANGLNEGLTELLATKIDHNESPQAYDGQVYVADMLVSPNNPKLVEAYFSENEDSFRDFLADFENRQDSIDGAKLTELSVKQNIIDDDLAKACIEYSLSYCNNEEQLASEQARLEKIANQIVIYNEEDLNTAQILQQAVAKRREELTKNAQTGE